MPEKVNTASCGQKSVDEPEKGSSPAGSSVESPGSRQTADDPAPKSVWKWMLESVSASLKSLNEEEEPEPPLPPEKPFRESLRDFADRCRDREKRIAMLKEFGKWSGLMLCRGAFLLLLFGLTIWGTSRALDFNEKHLIRFFPPDEVMDYLTTEHESLEALAFGMTPLVGRNDDIPFESFDAKCVETVKPVRIYSDEYGVYLMTSRSRFNGEHGIFIAKDAENMPPDLNRGVIEGRIYTYAIYD